MSTNKFKNNIKKIMTVLMLVLINLQTVAFASGQSAINTQEVTVVTTQLKDAIKALAIPIGSILVFLCIVFCAIRMILLHNNPNGRTGAVQGLFWVAAGALILGCSLLIAGIFMKISTNNGSMFGYIQPVNISALGSFIANILI